MANRRATGPLFPPPCGEGGPRVAWWVGVAMSTERARNLRKTMSPVEATVWSLLRAEPFNTFHFRRQVQLGPFYADFASYQARLVVEVDGSQHFTDDEQAYDRRRDAFMHKQGYRVLRFNTLYVVKNIEGVHAAIAAHLPHPPA